MKCCISLTISYIIVFNTCILKATLFTAINSYKEKVCETVGQLFSTTCCNKEIKDLLLRDTHTLVCGIVSR